MSAFVGLIAFMFFVVAIGSLILAIIRRLDLWNRAFEAVHKRYGGQFLRGYFLARPRIRFDYGRSQIRLQNRKSRVFRGHRRLTEMVMTWPDKHLALEIATRDSSIANKRFGRWSNRNAEDVNIEDQSFAEQVSVKSNDPGATQLMLSNAVRWQIEQLRRHMGNHSLRINLRRGELSIAKPGWIAHPQALEDFVRFGLELFDQMQLTLAEGIEFVNEDFAKLVDDVVCPICSEKIEYEMVVCLRCKTPHCQDCWQYNGQCATFACEETRYIRSNGQIVSN